MRHRKRAHVKTALLSMALSCNKSVMWIRLCSNDTYISGCHLLGYQCLAEVIEVLSAAGHLGAAHKQPTDSSTHLVVYLVVHAQQMMQESDYKACQQTNIGSHAGLQM